MSLPFGFEVGKYLCYFESHKSLLWFLKLRSKFSYDLSELARLQVWSKRLEALVSNFELELRSK